MFSCRNHARISLTWLFSLVVLAFVVGCANESDPPLDAVASSGPAETTDASQSTQTAEESATSGDATDITLEVVDLAGYRKVLEQHQGKVVFVDFWATWCTPCMENFGHTVHVARAFPQDQVAVISVSLDDPESKEAALAFLQKQEARFTNLLSELGAGVGSMEAFEIDSGVPHYKIYDRQGEVAKTLTPGPDLKITLELLEAEVRSVLDQS